MTHAQREAAASSCWEQPRDARLEEPDRHSVRIADHEHSQSMGMRTTVGKADYRTGTARLG
jgi:hypothetical protein